MSAVLVPLLPMRALCADCLRETVAVFDANWEAECTHCGGELCHCADCMQTIDRLKAGERRPSMLGLWSGVLIRSWTPEGGAL